MLEANGSARHYTITQSLRDGNCGHCSKVATAWRQIAISLSYLAARFLPNGLRFCAAAATKGRPGKVLSFDVRCFCSSSLGSCSKGLEL
eukprot:675821-Amphidinium_carterae.1